MSDIFPHPNNWREGRRLYAWHLYQQGWKQKDIALALGVTKGAVSQWFKKAKLQGSDALRQQPRPGGPSKLNLEQRSLLPGMLAKGAAAFGFRDNIWTTEKVAELIKQQFGVSYHPAHCSRLLKSIHYKL